jgi:hypothetical protein
MLDLISLASTICRKILSSTYTALIVFVKYQIILTEHIVIGLSPIMLGKFLLLLLLLLLFIYLTAIGF